MVIETFRKPVGLPSSGVSARLGFMDETPYGEVPQEGPPIKEGVSRFLFFQIKADLSVDRGYPHYSGPRNATIVLGVPKKPGRPIRVAFSTRGGSITHAGLEGIAAPPRTDYQSIKAQLRTDGPQNARTSTLEILTLGEEHVNRLEQQGFPYPDPYQLLPEQTLNSLCGLLGAHRFEFVQDTTPDKTINAAQKLKAPPAPGGIGHLRWKDQITIGD